MKSFTSSLPPSCWAYCRCLPRHRCASSSSVRGLDEQHPPAHFQYGRVDASRLCHLQGGAPACHRGQRYVIGGAEVSLAEMTRYLDQNPEASLVVMQLKDTSNLSRLVVHVPKRAQ